MNKYEFKAVIKSVDRGGSYIEFPYDVNKEFAKGRVRVIAHFEGVEYRGSLVKMGGDKHIIGILKDIKSKIGKDIGESVDVSIVGDNEERVVELHELLEDEFEKDRKLREKYEKLSYTNKKEINKMLFSSKKESTLLKNLKKSIENINGK